MNEELLEELLKLIEHEVLGWPGVVKKRDEDGPGGIGVTGYRFGRRQIGHIHDDGHADFQFPREVRAVARDARHAARADSTATRKEAK